NIRAARADNEALAASQWRPTSSTTSSKCHRAYAHHAAGVATLRCGRHPSAAALRCAGSTDDGAPSATSWVWSSWRIPCRISRGLPAIGASAGRGRLAERTLGHELPLPTVPQLLLRRRRVGPSHRDR